MMSPDALAAVLLAVAALLVAGWIGGFLAAAVVDDVLGRLLLSALVAGARGVGSARATALLGFEAVALLAFLVLGLPPLLRRLPHSLGPIPGVALCLGAGWSAHQVGLAP